MKIYCGCSGYQYDEWKVSFYPEDLPKEEWYHYGYSGKELHAWLDKIRKEKVQTAYVFFNNTAGGHAVENCRQFRELLD